MRQTFLSSPITPPLITMVNYIAHPFYPPDIDLIGYAANTMSIPVLLSVFALATLTIVGFTSAVLKKINPGLSRQDKMLACWFIFSKY